MAADGAPVGRVGRELLRALASEQGGVALAGTGIPAQQPMTTGEGPDIADTRDRRDRRLRNSIDRIRVIVT
jgi:hypothetical protein